jgi:hypothetical protein
LDRLGAHLDAALEPFPGRLWEQFVAVTSGWPELQQLLLVRFLGFPVWDTLILPIVELSEIRQLRPIDIVRISPRDGRPGRLPPRSSRARPSTTSAPSSTVPPASTTSSGGAWTGPNNS